MDVCHYCGCRDIPLVKDFIAEHESVTDLGGEAVRALSRGDLTGARSLARQMAAELRTHWQGEEEGLFAVMREDPDYLAYIDDLVHEHRELETFLATLNLEDTAQREAFVRAVDELHHHIAKEEDGLFPASLTALSGEQWDRAMAAWDTAHDIGAGGRTDP